MNLFRQEKKNYQAIVRFEKISNASYKISYLNWLFSYGLFMTYLLDSTHTTKKKEVDPWSNKTGQSYALYMCGARSLFI